MPDFPRRAPGSSSSSRPYEFLVAAWALWAAATSAYLFIWSTMPVNQLDEPPLWGPDWLFTIMYFFALSALARPLLLVPLLITGLTHLRRTARARWRWVLAWVLAGSAGISVEVLDVTDYALPFPAPNYMGPAVVSWPNLVEAVGFLAVGAAMLGVLIGAERSERAAAGRVSVAGEPG
jgi:hypothetical protein